MIASPLRFCVAPDKFKGSLSAAEAARAIRAGILDAIPDAEIDVQPLADGGEGTQAAFLAAVPSQSENCPAVDPLRRPLDVGFVRLTDESVAVVEIAEASGLQRLRVDERTPLLTTTLGAGMVLAHAANSGAKTVLVGLGGSSTNDAGCGVAHAFGWRFLDRNGAEIFPVPQHFLEIDAIVPPSILPDTRFIALADVNNPLLGDQGASRVYAAQKGASPQEIDFLEIAVEHLANIAAKCLGKDYRNQPGAGAAGGLGYGLMTFLNATIQPGFETIARYTDLEKAVRECDWVITGEGRLDRQSLEGKGPVALAKMARHCGRPVVALAGAVESDADFSTIFEAVFCIADRPMTLDESQQEATQILRWTARNLAGLLRSSPQM